MVYSFAGEKRMKNEDQNIEYKQSWRDEYLKWICGFANADGGRMFIGVSDDKKGNEVVGVADWKSLLENIPNLMRDTMGMIADVNHVRKGGKDIVEIFAQSRGPGDIMVRVGAAGDKSRTFEYDGSHAEE